MSLSSSRAIDGKKGKIVGKIKQCTLDKHLGLGSLLENRVIINSEARNWHFHGLS